MKSSRGSPGPGKTVLVVDSDPKAGATIVQALRRRGFDVASAVSTAAAMTSASQIRPAAIVVAIEPPEASSLLPLVRQLSEDSITQEIPVIVARCDHESLLAQTQRIGNVVVLFGDCSPETLATEVDRLLLGSADAPGSETHLGFPLTCPKCGEKAGAPRSVSTAGNRGTYITVVCEKCAQQWRVFRQADTPGFVKR